MLGAGVKGGEGEGSADLLLGEHMRGGPQRSQLALLHPDSYLQGGAQCVGHWPWELWLRPDQRAPPPPAPPVFLPHSLCQLP